MIYASSAGTRDADEGYGRPVIRDEGMTDGYEAVFLRRAPLNPAVLDDQSFFAFRDLDIFRAIVTGRYDVLWLMGYAYLSLVLAAIAQIATGRHVIFGENQTLLDAGSRPYWRRLAKNLGLNVLLTRGVGLYSGTENYNWFRHYGVRPERLFLSPYCVDNARLVETDLKLRPFKNELRSKLGIPSDSGPVVLCVSRLIPKKQPLFLLEAFKRARRQVRCSLLIVGSGELEGELRAAIREQQVSDVVLAGFMDQSQVGEAYVCADIFALPSARYETWGVVINEAMNFGLPILASDKVGSATDLVVHGKNGYVVSSRDPGDLANRIVELVRSATTRARFGEASRRLVSAWGVDAAASGVLEAVAAVVGPEQWRAANGG